MSTIVSLGIDLAKNVFALHGVDAAGKPVLMRLSVRRSALVELVARRARCWWPRTRHENAASCWIEPSNGRWRWPNAKATTPPPWRWPTRPHDDCGRPNITARASILSTSVGAKHTPPDSRPLQPQHRVTATPRYRNAVSPVLLLHHFNFMQACRSPKQPSR